MADVRTFLGQLLQASATSGKAPYSAARRQWLTTIDGHRQEWDALVAPGLSDESSPIAPQRAARELELAVHDDAIVVRDIRSEERSGGKGWVSTLRTRWSADQEKKKQA